MQNTPLLHIPLRLMCVLYMYKAVEWYYVINKNRFAGEPAAYQLLWIEHLYGGLVRVDSVL